MPATTSSTAASAPQKQAPMEMGARDGIVVAQPTAEPLPNADQPQLSLRGGELNCGFSCCGGSCRFHKSCC
ncbi:unnamed protein product [Clonostachys chloroleuca]|uniref:Uncharacterized protein n=1 Tax=Clonostachys chloroleuca TaxID=1926264 RepID=A0AA35LRN4_9HYPO|nr:unnamed protein product [Clonostachys chloroleuca]